MPWFTTNNFQMRGHAMVWEGESNWKPNAVTVYNSTTLTDQQKGDSLVNMLDDHLYHVIPKWDVECWDVVNEPWGNQKVNELLPNTNTLVHWFKLADSLRQVYGKPNLQLAVNENSIIANNLLYGDTKIDQYMAILDTMIAKGAPIEMLGFQSRLKNGMLSPDTIYSRLVRFERYGLPYQATEFELKDSPNYYYTPTEIKQATEESMITYFSHSKVDGFWYWSFCESPTGPDPNANFYLHPLFNYDGTSLPAGEKWIELMEGEFNTDTTLTTDSSGNCTTRGFKGDYEIEITYGDSTYVTLLSLNNDTTATIIINASTAWTGAADFSASDSTFCQGTSFTFTDLSTGNPTSWAWDFGDGNNSSLQNPTHTYASVGTYDVSLTVTTSTGSDSETKTGFITVNSNPNIDAGIDQTICDGSSTTLNATSGQNYVTGVTALGASDYILSGAFSGNDPA